MLSRSVSLLLDPSCPGELRVGALKPHTRKVRVEIVLSSAQRISGDSFVGKCVILHFQVCPTSYRISLVIDAMWDRCLLKVKLVVGSVGLGRQSHPRNSLQLSRSVSVRECRVPGGLHHQVGNMVASTIRLETWSLLLLPYYCTVDPDDVWAGGGRGESACPVDTFTPKLSPFQVFLFVFPQMQLLLLISFQ